jgi:pilus assembly protein FimV
MPHLRDRPLMLWLVGAAMAIIIPCAAHAAGLGRLTVNSGLGQPLNAEIELVAVKRGETITARLAPPEVYNQANAQFNPALVGTRVTVEKRPNGDLYLRASTPRPIQEPFIELIVELSSESGRVTRQYTALLDPPGYGRGAAEIPPRADAPAPPVAAAPEQAPAAAPATPQAESPAQSASAAAAPTKPAPGAKPPAAAKSAAGAGAGQYGPIKPGETLRGIARVVRPEGVTLEQTLVALHRHNPDAFIRKNMNLVRSGKILTIPEADEMMLVAQPEAVREVRLQLADFNSFRDRLAERAATSAPDEASATRGRIGSVVSDAAAAEPRDSVRVSRGEPPGQAATPAKGTSDERIRVLEEEAIARQRALAEATDRINQLERTIKDMQRLAELKTSGAPAPAQKAADALKLQSSAEPKGTAAPSGAAAPRVEQSQGVAAGGTAPNASSQPSPGPGTSGDSGSIATQPSGEPPKDAAGGPVAVLPPTAAPTSKPAPKPSAEPSGGFLSNLMEPLYLGLAAVVLLGMLALLAMRRRRAARMYDEDEDKIAPTFVARTAATPAGTSAPSTPVMAATGSAFPKSPDTRGVVGGAQPASPPRPRTSSTDNDLDFDLSPRGSASAPSAARSGAAAPDAKRTAATTEPKRADAPTAPAGTPLSASTPAGGASSIQQASAVGAAAALGTASTASRVTERSSPTSQSPATPDVRQPLRTDAPASAARAQTDSKPSNVIDFDLDSPPQASRTIDAMGAERVSSEPPPREFEFKLDLDNLDLSAPGEEKTAVASKDAHWHDVQQKFDLAKAYEEMGDKGGARDILREVLKEGDHEQRIQATQLIAKLG